MKYRCINNLFGYCSAQPLPEGGKKPTDWMNKVGDVTYRAQYSTQCKYDPLTCSFFISWPQECQHMVVLEGEK